MADEKAAVAGVQALVDEVLVLRAENTVLRAQVAASTPTPTPVPPKPPLTGKVRFGAFVDGLPGDHAAFTALERKIGKLGLASAFADWSTILGGPDDEWMADGGNRHVLYSWEPWGIRFADITAGHQDAYLQRVADSMRAYPHDLYVRPWGEMNANWSTWQPTPDGAKRDGGTPAEFIAAWRHLVGFFNERELNNLKFVFAPDASNYGNNTPIPSIWPGANYVDVLGIDGYNWGRNTATGDTWREYDTIFANMYGILTGLHPTAPVWITETGCKEPSASDGAPVDLTHTKAAWLANMFKSTRFPKVEAIAYFSVKKERDWRLDSTAGATTAVKTALAARPVA